MRSTLKYIILLAIMILMLLTGFYWGKNFKLIEQKKEENSTVIIEKIEKVAKLISVEATMSEIYSYKDYYNWDLPFLRKQALVRVNAKVSAGFDIKKMNIKIDSKTSTVTIGPLPPAEILSIDHNLDYFDLEQGVFNSFTNKDYNHINASAKKYIENIAKNSEAIKQASVQQNELVEMIRLMVQSMGYTLVVLENKSSLEIKN